MSQLLGYALQYPSGFLLGQKHLRVKGLFSTKEFKEFTRVTNINEALFMDVFMVEEIRREFEKGQDFKLKILRATVNIEEVLEK